VNCIAKKGSGVQNSHKNDKVGVPGKLIIFISTVQGQTRNERVGETLGWMHNLNGIL
jgi:hypothetical protein